MRRSHLVLTGAAIAGAAVTGSAFTAANTLPASVAGYGQAVVTGATVTNIHYVANGSDGTVLDSVEFTTTTNITGRTATMTLKTTGGTVVVGSPYSCAEKEAWDTTDMVIECDTTGTVRNFADFDSVGLTVIQ